MTIQEAVYNFFKIHPKWNNQANEGLLLTNCQRPVTVETLEAAALRLGNRLATNGDYARAYSAFYRNHPEIEPCDATNSIMDKAHNGDNITMESLEELFQNPNIRAVLPENQRLLSEKREQQQAANHRNQLINEITQGRKTYGWWDSQHGQMRYADSAHLQDESDERLEEIANVLREQRNLVGGKPPQQQQPTEDFTLINSETGVEYTRKELVNMPKAQIQRLVFRNSVTADPRVTAAITRILKGKI